MQNTELIRRALAPERVLMLDCRTKKQALQALLACLATAPEVTDPQELAKGIWHREELMSTGIGLGVAVPHVRLASVRDIVMAVGVSREDILDYESLDGRPVRIIFMVAAPAGQHGQYIRLLSAITSRLKDEAFRRAVLEAPDAASIFRLLTQQRD
mgnify:CR=1 FL=1